LVVIHHGRERTDSPPVTGLLSGLVLRDRVPAGHAVGGPVLRRVRSSVPKRIHARACADSSYLAATVEQAVGETVLVVGTPSCALDRLLVRKVNGTSCPRLVALGK